MRGRRGAASPIQSSRGRSPRARPRGRRVLAGRDEGRHRPRKREDPGRRRRSRGGRGGVRSASRDLVVDVHPRAGGGQWGGDRCEMVVGQKSLFLSRVQLSSPGRSTRGCPQTSDERGAVGKLRISRARPRRSVVLALVMATGAGGGCRLAVSDELVGARGCACESVSWPWKERPLSSAEDAPASARRTRSTWQLRLGGDDGDRARDSPASGCSDVRARRASSDVALAHPLCRVDHWCMRMRSPPALGRLEIGLHRATPQLRRGGPRLAETPSAHRTSGWRSRRADGSRRTRAHATAAAHALPPSGSRRARHRRAAALGPLPPSPLPLAVGGSCRVASPTMTWTTRAAAAQAVAHSTASASARRAPASGSRLRPVVDEYATPTHGRHHAAPPSSLAHLLVRLGAACDAAQPQQAPATRCGLAAARARRRGAELGRHRHRAVPRRGSLHGRLGDRAHRRTSSHATEAARRRAPRRDRELPRWRRRHEAVDRPRSLRARRIHAGGRPVARARRTRPPSREPWPARASAAAASVRPNRKPPPSSRVRASRRRRGWRPRRHPGQCRAQGAADGLWQTLGSRGVFEASAPLLAGRSSRRCAAQAPPAARAAAGES